VFTIKRYLPPIVLLAVFVFLAGCTTIPAPDQPLPQNAEISAILSALQDQDADIQTFWASGKFVLQAPDLPEVYLLRQSSIYYEAPDRLNIIGRKYTKAVLELTAIGEEFLLVLPTEGQYYKRSDKDQDAATPYGNVSPAQLVGEMFFLRPWAGINVDAIEVLEVREDGSRVLLFPFEDRAAYRREVVLKPEPWRIAEMRLYDESGALVAETWRKNYEEQNGHWFPTYVEARFPMEDAFMRFETAGFDINVPLERADFDLQAQYDAVLRKEYDEIVWSRQP
jgi:hypothetical protein